MVERFGGEVPSAMADLVTLPGVGRKTANVVRSVAFGLPGLPVDTHVQRLSRRLGLTEETDPVKVETALNAMIPAARRGAFSLRLILHGRATCTARRPDCDRCVLSDFCPSAPWAPAVTRSRPGRTRDCVDATEPSDDQRPVRSKPATRPGHVVVGKRARLRHLTMWKKFVAL